MQTTELEILYNKWFLKTATAEEKDLLIAILEKGISKRELAPLIANIWEMLEDDETLSYTQRQQMADNILSKYPGNTTRPTAHRVHFLRTAWFRYAAAVLLVVAVSAYLWFAQKNNNEIFPVTAVEEIKPGTNRAILAIGNKIIRLDSNKPGIAVANTITYTDGERIADAGQLLQLTTPRGGQYQVVLPDGSKVWLNAASSVKFPSKFSGDKREIEITGEVYVEIAKNIKQPFFVHTKRTLIQVLGTSFNVNAYEDEQEDKTTLLTGRVLVSPVSGGKVKELQPGQQARIINNQLSIINDQSEAAIAWKNGIFNFNKMDLKEVLRQLSRWYNIDIVYEKEVSNIMFGGKMDRNLTLPQVLKALEKSEVHFRIEGRKLIVMP